jgi:hypothetical protein
MIAAITSAAGSTSQASQYGKLATPANVALNEPTLERREINATANHTAAAITAACQSSANKTPTPVATPLPP